jgi:hypothetical protein
MSYRLDEADELALVGDKRAVVRRHRISTALKPSVDASHSTVNCLAKSGMARTGADVMAALSAVNVAAVASSQEKPSFLSKVVNGAAIAP